MVGVYTTVHSNIYITYNPFRSNHRYNFAIVGTVAIFYQKGIPQYINQTYLVLTSVIVAWQLSYFTDWMAWALLVMLALYDLFAVLTPCGPLKALVKLMSKEDAPAMPGLLYEARLPENATRPGRDGGDRRSSSSSRDDGSSTAADAMSSPTSVTNNAVAGCSREWSVQSNNLEMASSQQQQVTTTSVKSNPSSRQEEVTMSQRVRSPSAADNSMSAVEAGTRTSMSNPTHSRTASLPLAIAKVYKLPLVIRRCEAIHTSITTIDTSSPTSYLQQEFSAQELKQNVIVKFPRGGGRIESALNDDEEVRYVVYNRDGEIRRTLVVDENGKVMEVVKSSTSKSVGENNIKLGLGDFIFYSVLVSKAAENSFAAFVACFISILMGLGGTLVLLAVYHKALPALPISIFLAVVFFVLTIYCMSPWIEVMWQVPYYV